MFRPYFRLHIRRPCCKQAAAAGEQQEPAAAGAAARPAGAVPQPGAKGAHGCDAGRPADRTAGAYRRQQPQVSLPSTLSDHPPSCRPSCVRSASCLHSTHPGCSLPLGGRTACRSSAAASAHSVENCQATDSHNAAVMRAACHRAITSMSGLTRSEEKEPQPRSRGASVEPSRADGREHSHRRAGRDADDQVRDARGLLRACFSCWLLYTLQDQRHASVPAVLGVP